MSSASRQPRLRAALAVAVAAVTVAASGCTVANSSHGGYDPNTLRIVLSQEPPTLEPC
jgi:peptide/nickel transport system substrate-binding protein